MSNGTTLGCISLDFVKLIGIDWMNVRRIYDAGDAASRVIVMEVDDIENPEIADIAVGLSRNSKLPVLICKAGESIYAMSDQQLRQAGLERIKTDNGGG